MPQIDLRNWGKGRPDTPAPSTSTPSKEQFEAAAQRVMQSAPPGLSREDFFNLIEQELAPKVSGHDLLTHAGMALDSPVDETGKPTQGDSPFLSKLKGMMSDAAAPPTSLLDLAKKISLFTLPSAGSVGSYSGVGGDLIPDTIGRARAATKAAVGETSGVGSALSLPLRVVGKFKNALPTSNIDRVDKFTGDMGAAPVTAPLSPGSAGSDLYGIAKSNHEPFTPSSGSGSGGAPLGTRPPSSGGAPSSAPIPSDISSITGRPNAIPGVDAGDIVRQGYREAAASHATDLDGLLNKFGGKGPEFKSGWPPEGGQGDWHSGAEPGSTDAAMAHTLHPETRALDDAYSQKINDPLAALLMSLGIGAGAYGAQK